MMAVSNWDQRANEIFLQAAEIPDPTAREQFVRATCGADPSLRQAVDDLLRACEASGNFLERPLAQLPEEIRRASADLIPERVGRYRILHVLGEGGMGVVYLAQQESPVLRKVALKIIKPGLDTRQIIARFEAERQVLAMMDHPNIATVFDAGATEAGRPYFVMELVSGVPLTEYCESQDLSRRDRLHLFIAVCNAVQHAHQKGIIHRDLKPSNILVSGQKSNPVVKVIDFGVAKAIEPQSPDETLTVATQWVGTPLYMSPEQASGGAIDIDTRSDVYSLGVLLYELLTGTTPVDASTLRTATDELERRQIIRDFEPPRPSARVAAIHDRGKTRVADRRPVDFQRLSRQLRGELDWVVMKALEKDRDRRYDSASALAADLERYLNEEPVSAGPPSQLYRLRKFAWRFRRPLTTGVVILVALVVGFAVAIWQAIEATHARFLADERLQRAQESEAETRRLSYTGDMRLAVDAWKADDVRRMREILERQEPRDGEADLRDFGWFFLNRQSGVPSTVLLTSSKPLHSVRVSPDGRFIAAAGADGPIHLFDSRSLKLLRKTETQTSEVNAIEFSPDSRLIYSCDDEGTVAVWDVNTARELRRAVAQPADEEGHPGKSYGLAVLPDGKTFVTDGPGFRLQAWDRKSMKVTQTVGLHVKVVQALAGSSTGFVASGSDDHTVSMWKPGSSQPLWIKTDQPPSRVNNLAFSPDGVLLATVHQSGLMTIRGTADGAHLGQQKFPESLHSVTFTPALRANSSVTWVAVGDRSGNVSLIPSGLYADNSSLLPDSSTEGGRRWKAHEGRIYSMAFTADGERLLTAGDDGRLKIWSYEDSMNARRLPMMVSDFALIDSDTIAVTGEQVSIVSLKTGAVVRTVYPSSSDFVQYLPATRELYFRDARGRMLASGNDDRKPRVVHQSPRMSGSDHFTVSPDGRAIMSITLSDDEKFFEIDDLLRPPGSLRIQCTNMVHSLHFTPDGQQILFDNVKDVIVADARSGDRLYSLSGHGTSIRDFAFSPDGETLATVSADRTVRVWDWRNGRELWKETAHENESTAVAFSPNGMSIATAGIDGTLRLWRWKEKVSQVFEYRLLDWPVRKLAFAAGGKVLLVNADDGLRIYDGRPDPSVPPGAPLEKTP